jgi:hypothetical protein
MNTSPIAASIERRVEERPEDRALARGARERAVEDVGDRADDEQEPAEPEEELLVPLLEADENRPGHAERDAGEREHVRRQLRLRDAAHRAREDLACGLRVLLLDPVELADPGLPVPGRPLFAHARRARSVRTCRSA